jgi:hypothetical protein
VTGGVYLGHNLQELVDFQDFDLRRIREGKEWQLP